MVKIFGKGDKGKYVCAICKKQFSDKAGLMKHEETHINDSEKKEEIKPVKKPEKIVTKQDYIKIGIPGFDELIEKGVPKGNAILISGGPGSGKTIFCLQIANFFVEKGKRCVYMSFEEEEAKLKQHMKDFGWDPDKNIKNGNLAIKGFDPFEVVRLIEAMVEESKGELLIKTPPIKFLKEFMPDIVVVDSLSAVAAAFSGHETSYRLYISQLFRYLNSMGVTSFVITETEEIPTEITRRGCEEFLADGVILLYNLKKTDIRISALEILKMRGVKHQKRIVPMQITEKGIVIYPKQEVFEALET
ncbi:MAG: AAA family ATPase [Candidatus Aenigmarchaeota archaeon]|nr:AAA family ATPase [Candidatus Aenigmarchaeota archaeon]